jgi:hypothetical protein
MYKNDEVRLLFPPGRETLTVAIRDSSAADSQNGRRDTTGRELLQETIATKNT